MTKRSLRAHLLLWLALAVILPVGLSVALANRAYTAGFLAQFERRTAVTLDTCLRLLNERGESLFEASRTLAASPDLKRALREADRFAAVRILSNAGLRGDVELALFDAAGEPLARVPESASRPFLLTPVERELYAQGRAGFDLEAAPGGLRFVAGCPVLDAGAPAGRIALRRALDPHALREVTDLAGGILAVATSRGFVSSDPEALHAPPEGVAGLAPGRRLTRLHDAAGSRFVITAETLDRYADPLLVLSGVNIDAAHAALRQTRLMILAAGLVGLLFALLVSNLLAARVAVPLEALAEAATELAAQGPSRAGEELPASDVREVAALSGAFLAMRQNLKRSFDLIRATNLKLDGRLREISLLNRMNEIIAEHADHERMLPSVLELLARELRVEKCSVMVLSSRRELIVKETWPKYAAIDPAAPHITLEWGTGVAGIAVAERRIINAPSGAADPRYRKAAGDPGRSANLVSVPLVTERETVGVLNLVNRRDGPFDPSDHDLLETLARTVSVALAKVILNEVAITDGLTGLYVKRYFNARLDEEGKRAKRYAHPLALVLCDLDHFKALNDTYGHQAGDEVLKRFAERLRDRARLDTDIPARVGGEEFALLLPMNGPEGARTLAERVRASVADAPFEVAGVSLSMTVSIGIAAIPDHAATPEELVRRADLALYEAKRAGRNRVVVFSSGLLD